MTKDFDMKVLPETRAVETDEQLKILFSKDDIKPKDFEVLINSKVHVDDVYQIEEVDKILENHQGQLNDHENRIGNLETAKLEGGSGSDHSHLNKDVLDVVTYSGSKSEVDLYDIEKVKGNVDTHFSNTESHTTTYEKENWNYTGEKVTQMETSIDVIEGQIKLKVSKEELERVEAKIDGIALGSTNLLRNSNFTSNFSLWTVIGQPEIIRENDKNWCLLNKANLSVGQLVSQFRANQPYILALDLKGEGSLHLEIHQRGDGDNDPVLTREFVATPTTLRHEFIFIADNDALENSFYITLKSIDNCNLKFTDIKFEQSDVPTDWTPHSSDVLLEVDELKNELNGLKDYMDVAFKDGILTQAEIKILNERITGLNKEKKDVEVQVGALLSNGHLNNTVERNTLSNNFNEFTSSHESLVNAILTAIEDSVITTIESSGINALMEDYIEKLSNINLSIQNAVNKITEVSSSNSLQSAKSYVDGEINDVQLSLNSLKDLTDSAFLDGIISVSEAQSLGVMIKDLVKEKTEVIAEVDKIEAEPELSGTQELLALGVADAEFITSHTNLINCIERIIANKKVEDNEKLEFDTLYEDYKIKLIKLRDASQKALDKFYAVKLENSMNAMKENINKEINEVKDSVSSMKDLTDKAFADSVLSVAEKEALKIQLKNIEKEHNDVLSQIAVFQSIILSPELIGTDELSQLNITETNFKSKYSFLVRSIEDVLGKTLIGQADRDKINSSLSEYVKVLEVVRVNIHSCNNKIAEVKAKNQADEIKDNLVYKLEIFSTKGGVFKNGEISTTLIAKVYFGKEEITNNFLPTRFRWTRVSSDEADDERWNLNVERNFAIDVTSEDVIKGRSTFNCELLDEQGNRIVSAF